MDQTQEPKCGYCHLRTTARSRGISSKLRIYPVACERCLPARYKDKQVRDRLEADNRSKEAARRDKGSRKEAEFSEREISIQKASLVLGMPISLMSRLLEDGVLKGRKLGDHFSQKSVYTESINHLIEAVKKGDMNFASPILMTALSDHLEEIEGRIRSINLNGAKE